jgi:hypothetical protein
MYKKLDELVVKYPLIFANRSADIRDSAMAWGFECGDGWYNILDQLCHYIQSRINDSTKDTIPQVIADQVKEKFGGLRFYYHGGDGHIEGAVALAENLSYVTCEECGAPGSLLRNTGWIKVRCEKHN